MSLVFRGQAWCVAELYANAARLDTDQEAIPHANAAVAATLQEALLSACALVLVGSWEPSNSPPWVCDSCGIQERKQTDMIGDVMDDRDLWWAQHRAACADAAGAAPPSPYRADHWVRLAQLQSIAEYVHSSREELPQPLMWLLRQRRHSALHMLWDLERCVHRLFCDGSVRTSKGPPGQAVGCCDLWRRC